MMRTRPFTTVLFLAVLLCAFAVVTGAQDPQDQTVARGGVKLGKVYVTGENPVIRLFDKQNGTPLTFVSYWRIAWSPVGPGRVCYVTTGDGKSPADVRVALTDNRELDDFLTREIMSVLDPSIQARPFSVVQATFNDPGQGVFNNSLMQERTIGVNSSKYKIRLTWRDFIEPFQFDTPVGGARNPFGVASLFIPARDAEVMINGKKAPGNVYPQMRGPAQSSTAFLAFSESWVK